MNAPEPLAFSRTRLTWQAYLTIAYYSYLLNALGPLTPFLRQELNLTYTQASFHFSAFALGIILMGFLTNWGVQHFGVRGMVWIGVFGMALGCLLLIFGWAAPVTVAGAFLMGFLGVTISALFSSALAEQHGVWRGVALVESTMIASLFATLSPVAVSFFAGTFLTWRAALALMLLGGGALWLVYGKDPLGLPSAPSVGAHLCVRPGSTHSSPGSTPRSTPTDAGTLRKEAPGGLPAAYWLYWSLAFLAEAAEFCVTFWAAEYLETGIGFTRANAVLGVSIFMGAVLVGRWGVSRLLRRSQEQHLLLNALFVALGGFLAFWLAPGGTLWGGILALAGLLVTGLGIAGLFPMINSLALSSAPDRMIEASGRISWAMGGSIFLMPLLLARLADSFDIRAAYAVELGLLLAAIGLLLVPTRSVGTPIGRSASSTGYTTRSVGTRKIKK
jgi:MFS family permease